MAPIRSELANAPSTVPTLKGAGTVGPITDSGVTPSGAITGAAYGDGSDRSAECEGD
jgi:hypothetical protein